MRQVNSPSLSHVSTVMYLEATEPKQQAKKAMWKETMTLNKYSLLLSNVHKVFAAEMET